MGGTHSSSADASRGDRASAPARAAALPSAGATKPRAGFDAAARDLSAALPAAEPATAPASGLILFGSQTGTARRLARAGALAADATRRVLTTTDANDFDPEDLVHAPVAWC